MPKQFTDDEIAGYIKKRIEAPFYKITVEKARKIRVHADGLCPEELLYKRRPNEPLEVMEYRKSVFIPKTKSTFGRVYSSLQKIRRSSDWNIAYPEKNLPRIAEGERLEDYCEVNYPGFESVTNWVFSLMLRKYLIDPNAVVLVLPQTFDVPDNEYVKPVAQVFDSAEVMDFVAGELAVLYQEKGSVYTTSKGTFRGKRFYFVTDVEVLIYDQVDGRETMKQVLQYEFPFMEMPAFQLRGIMIDQLADQYLYESRISAIVPELDEAIQEYSDLQAAKILHIYPERWEFSQNECTSCKGTGKRPNPLYTGPGCGCESTTVCNSCVNGYVVAGPYSKMIIRPVNNGMGEGNIPNPPAGYVEKDVEIVKIMEESVERHIYSALAAINFEFLAKVPLAESGVAKEVDRDELNNTVHSIAEDIVAAMDNVYYFTALERYSGVYDAETIHSEMLPTIAVPERYDLLSSTHSLEDLKTLKETNSNSVLQSAAEVEYAGSRFSSNPKIKDAVQLQLRLDPLPNESEDVKMSRLSNRGITEETYIISSNIIDFIRRAIEENPKFPEIPVADQRAKMMEYAQAVIVSRETLPDPVIPEEEEIDANDPE